MHLGGCDGVTAYNIEDNELWSRHLLTTVSQVTVAVYVFCNSWPWPPGGDKRLLQTSILLFTVGAVKCFMKAWAFKRASIYSLVSSAAAAGKRINDGNMCNGLEDYVKLARDVVVRQQQPEDHQAMEEEEEGPGMSSSKDAAAEVTSNHLYDSKEQQRLIEEQRSVSEERGEASKLFVGLSSPYPRRIRIFKKFWGVSEESAYYSVQAWLASAFFLLYTKLITIGDLDELKDKYIGYELGEGCQVIIELCIMAPRMILPWASIALFHHSHREAYNGSNNESFRDPSLEVVWPETVAQYSLVGYFVRNKKHNIKMRIVSLVGCKDFLDQHWCLEPCFSSARITDLILGYLKDGWEQKKQDVASYHRFNNHNSHWGLNMNRPFDECVLLWQLATDFCFFSSSFPNHAFAFAEELENPTSTTGNPQCNQESAKHKAVQCREMSNYMVYLLFVNPEMLLPGSRQNLFKIAYGELKDILRDWEWNPVCWSRCTPSGVKLMKEEAIVMGRLITVMQQKPEKRAFQEESSTEGSNIDENFINQAWALAQRLSKMGEMKMWEEIQDVWVQMLCFSASRCREYLHAKALGQGGEFLSYVWLLLFYMGMETFSERLQRELLPSYQGNFHNSTVPPSISEVSTTVAGAPSASEVHTHAGTDTTPSTS